MARAKNRGYQQTLTPTYTIRRWRLGAYIRLSKEDLKKGKDDSNSVKNQRDLLGDFYRRHMNEFESAVEYVDDGHTGTDANRENFQRLLADVMSGKINCVIVKDLSRFARNYSDAGSLIDNLFVQMGVRFISLAENVDSYLNPDSVSNIIVPITNVMNDNYCYQTSKKIRQVFDYKRRNGQYIGSFAPYGYIKDPKDKHQLIVDADAAEIVKRVYSMLLQGSSKRAIALYLNEHGTPSPTAYRRKKGLPVSSAVADDPMWGARMIHEILTEAYRKARNKEKYRAEHERGIILHEAAAKALKAAQIGGKLPSVPALQAEYEKLQAQKESLYADYGKLKKQVQEYDVIKRNIDSILQTEKQPERERQTERG